MSLIEYTGIKKFPIIPTVIALLLTFGIFYQLNELMIKYIGYLPFSRTFVHLFSAVVVDFLIVYSIVLLFIKVRRKKESEISTIEEQIEKIFDEPLSIFLYNLDKLLSYIIPKIKKIFDELLSIVLYNLDKLLSYLISKTKKIFNI